MDYLYLTILLPKAAVGLAVSLIDLATGLGGSPIRSTGLIDLKQIYKTLNLSFPKRMLTSIRSKAQKIHKSEFCYMTLF